jgi:hypothetical protein
MILQIALGLAGELSAWACGFRLRLLFALPGWALLLLLPAGCQLGWFERARWHPALAALYPLLLILSDLLRRGGRWIV